MAGQAHVDRPPRWLLRAGAWPALLVRIGAGRLLGKGMVVVTHRGRRSGRLYRTAVQALDRDAATGELYVVAWSREADWYKNVVAEPAVEVWDAGTTYRPEQRILTGAEIADKLLVQRRAHRFQAVMRGLFIPAPRTRADAERYAALAGGLAFKPQLPRRAETRRVANAGAKHEPVPAGSRGQ